MSVVDQHAEFCFSEGACAGCQEWDWCRASDRLCFYCRKGPVMDEIKAITVQPPSTAALMPHSQAFADYLSPDSQAFVLATDEDLQLATDIINDIKNRLKAIEALRVSVTGPLNAALRTFNSFFKPRTEEGEAARALFDKKIVTYVRAKEEQRRRDEVALQAAIVSEQPEKAMAVIQTMQPATKVQGLSLVEAWTFQEFNHDIVPTSLTVLDSAAVKAEIKRQLAEGVTQPAIPGVRVFKAMQTKATG